ncbi:hypothetical protein VM98_35715, partial [Streptomyces rubellomurinus subsp. indigoferus]
MRAGTARTDHGGALTPLLHVAAAGLRRRKTAVAGSYLALTLGVTLVATTGSLLHQTAGDDSPLG